ncbi:hypothetical protein PtrSN002B_005014 [Pyrenophora tritici-repentis]|nr:hypothetical protein PtrV1_11106 [Pyrenophora tritici-repentis]KAF7443703.1 hypothetical protein A1F99_117770 [Pyrenophora tritici-repentis]KAF7566574.1 hypothetical protein PtrM4_148940 [Pyrenophora tritici-repentis]KAG9379443.1 hypothetical protein A1F94_009799 [Pyrenophora tritici-repentis]KAI0578897.1 hypothetical protein Alg215_06069 [Pyrenophora tritici-repentis]
MPTLLEEGTLSDSPPEVPGGRISGVGLRNSIDIPASPDGTKTRSLSGGVVEQVVRLSSSPKTDKSGTGGS